MPGTFGANVVCHRIAVPPVARWLVGGTVLLAPTDSAGFRSAALAAPQGGVIAISQRTPTG